MSDMDQSEIDRLLAAALSGGGAEDSTAGEIPAVGADAEGPGEPPPEEDPGPAPASADDAEDEGSASQSDIDSLIAGMVTSADEEEAEEVPLPGEEDEGAGPDLETLLESAAAAPSPEPDGEESPAAAEVPEPVELQGGPAESAVLDQILSGAGEAEEPPGEEAAPEADLPEPPSFPEEDTETDEAIASGAQSQDDIDQLLAGIVESGDLPEDVEEEVQSGSGVDDLDSLLKAASVEAPIAEMPEEEEAPPAAPPEEPPAAVAVEEEPEDAPASAASEGAALAEESNGSKTLILDEEPPVAAGEAAAEEDREPVAQEEPPDGEIPSPEDVWSAEPPPAEPEPDDARTDGAASGTGVAPAVPQELSEEKLQAIHESLSLMGSAGEVEGLAGQIASLLGQLSERARRYQSAWLGSDQETKELRTRLSNEEHRRAAVESERESLQNEVSKLRRRLIELEEAKSAEIETRNERLQALEAKLRDGSAREQYTQAEVQSLKEELERARSEATRADLAARRAHFEADRMQASLDSERQERLRLQRALQNREKELQALQAHTAGQASSLFLDELHRLVRRLESELDLRTSAAHEGLVAFEKLRPMPGMEETFQTVMAAIKVAAGLQEEEDDALQSLARETARTGGRAAEERPPHYSREDFAKAIARYEFKEALEAAVQLMIGGDASPAALMDMLYRTPELREPAIADHIDGVVKLLGGLKSVQEAADLDRGQESPEAGRFYVQMFDYLHGLVRAKLVTRAQEDAWRFFLELRGRFSFVTSDKEWTAHRDAVLSGA